MAWLVEIGAVDGNLTPLLRVLVSDCLGTGSSVPSSSIVVIVSFFVLCLNPLVDLDNSFKSVRVLDGNTKFIVDKHSGV